MGFGLRILNQCLRVKFEFGGLPGKQFDILESISLVGLRLSYMPERELPRCF